MSRNIAEKKKKSKGRTAEGEENYKRSKEDIQER